MNSFSYGSANIFSSSEVPATTDETQIFILYSSRKTLEAQLRASNYVNSTPLKCHLLVDLFAEIGIALLINVISVQKFNCLSF